MNLFFLRHASAGVKRSNPKLDARRPLDKEGKRHCLDLAHVINALRINFDLIISSSLKRSLQTASLVGTEAGYEAPILVSDALAPEAKLADFQDLMRTFGDRENVMVVGHNPNLTCFLGSLLVTPGGPGDGDRAARVRLRKGAIARVSITRGPGMLMGLLDPRTVRALYMTSTKRSRRKTSLK